MHNILRWKQRPPRENDNERAERIGNVIDTLLYKTGAYHRNNSTNSGKYKKEKNNEEEGKSSDTAVDHTYSVTKHRNCAPQGITAAVSRGVNPFFVSLRSEQKAAVNNTPTEGREEHVLKGKRKRKPQSRREQIPRVVDVIKKRRETTAKGPSSVCKPSAVSSSPSPTITTTSTTNWFPPAQRTTTTTVKDVGGENVCQLHSRSLSARKLRGLSKGTTKAVSLFRLFKTVTLVGQSRSVKGRRYREKKKENGESLDSAFWNAVAAIVEQRTVYKNEWVALWKAHQSNTTTTVVPVATHNNDSDSNSNSNNNSKLLLPLLRAFPLFGLVVDVELLRWQQQDTKTLSFTVDVISTTRGIVIHESAQFIGVALLDAVAAPSYVTQWKCLHQLAEEQQEQDEQKTKKKVTVEEEYTTAERTKKPPVGRVLRVVKAFPGGVGTKTTTVAALAAAGVVELNRGADAECVLAKVASAEVGEDHGNPFKHLVGCYL